MKKGCMHIRQISKHLVKYCKYYDLCEKECCVSGNVGARFGIKLNDDAIEFESPNHTASHDLNRYKSIKYKLNELTDVEYRGMIERGELGYVIVAINHFINIISCSDTVNLEKAYTRMCLLMKDLKL